MTELQQLINFYPPELLLPHIIVVSFCRSDLMPADFVADLPNNRSMLLGSPRKLSLDLFLNIGTPLNLNLFVPFFTTFS